MLERMKELQDEVSILRVNYWIEEVLFSFQWWFLVISMFIFVYIWIKIVDQTKLVKILLYGSISFSIINFLDVLGSEFILWDYPAMIIPGGSRIICINIIITIIFMTLYQYFNSWKTYLIASTVTSLTFSFVLEPLAIFMDIYQPYTWEHIYSFPIYILIMVSVKWFVDKLVFVQAKHKQ